MLPESADAIARVQEDVPGEHGEETRRERRLILLPGRQQELFTPEQEVRIYHGQGPGGPAFFSIVQYSKDVYTDARGREYRRPRQQSFEVAQLAWALRNLPTDRDSYISQAEFYKPLRRVLFLRSLSLSFLDLDNAVGRWPDPAKAVLLYCDEERIPHPSVIVWSGRGMHLKWAYQSAIPNPAYPRWYRLQKLLAKKFESFGADFKALDGARVLRIPGTLNSRSQSKAFVLWPSHASDVALYDFESFAAEIFPLSREEIEQARQERKRGRKEQRARLSAMPRAQRGIAQFRKGVAELWWSRLSDIRRLAELRGGVRVGQRDLYLFLGTVALTWVTDLPRLHDEVSQLAKEIVPSLPHHEALTAMGSAVRRAARAAAREVEVFNGRKVDPRYAFRNDTLIDWLEITPDEERELSTIISVGTARERKRAQDEARRRARGERNRNDYLLEARTRSRARSRMVLELQASGLTRRQVAERMGMTLDAVKSLLKRAGSNADAC